MFTITKHNILCVMLFSLFFLCIVLHFTNAWGTDAQRVIAHAAYNMVSKETQEFIRNAVDAHELFYFAAQVEDYKAHKIGEWSEPLHAINVESIENPSLETFNLINAVNNYTERLQKEVQNTGTIEKCHCFIPESNLTREPCSLAMLSHFVADLHQPMQIRSSSKPSICSVKTYNTYMIGSESEAFYSNFCSLWRDDIPQQWSKNWMNTWDQIITFHKVKSVETIEQLIGSMNPKDWAKESKDLWEEQWNWIQKHRHQPEKKNNVKEYNNNSNNSNNEDNENNIEYVQVDWDYYTFYIDVLLKRMTVASLRLTRLLDHIIQNSKEENVSQHDEL